MIVLSFEDLLTKTTKTSDLIWSAVYKNCYKIGKKDGLAVFFILVHDLSLLLISDFSVAVGFVH